MTNGVDMRQGQQNYKFRVLLATVILYVFSSW